MLPIAGLLLASIIQSSGTYFYAPWDAIHCLNNNGQPIDIISVSFITVWLVTAFANRISNVCVADDKQRERSWLFQLILDRIDPLPSGQTRLTNVEILEAKAKVIKQQPKKGFTLVIAELFQFAIVEFSYSFAWEISWLMFSFGYGLSSTIIAWSSCFQPDDALGSCWDSVVEMGFGQIVPIVLLVLPALAFLESMGKLDTTHILVPPLTDDRI